MSWQWRRGDCEIDSIIDTVNTRMRQLEYDVRSRLSMEWVWTTIQPCDPCMLLDRLNRQMYEMTTLLRSGTDATFTWRKVQFTGDLGQMCGSLDRGFRRLQWAVNTASSSTVFTIYPDNAGSGNNVGTNETWAAIRVAIETDATEGGAGKSTVAEAIEDLTSGWQSLSRGFLSFDTSSVTGTISTATVKIKVADFSDALDLAFGLYVYSPGVALPTSIGANDAFWSDLMSNSAELASDDTFATGSLTLDQELTFTLNSAGTDHIDVSGTTAFTVLLTDDFDNTDPGSGGNEDDGSVYSYAWDHATPSNRPVLTVTTS